MDFELLIIVHRWEQEMPMRGKHRDAMIQLLKKRGIMDKAATTMADIVMDTILNFMVGRLEKWIKERWASSRPQSLPGKRKEPGNKESQRKRTRVAGESPDRCGGQTTGLAGGMDPITPNMPSTGEQAGTPSSSMGPMAILLAAATQTACSGQQRGVPTDHWRP